MSDSNGKSHTPFLPPTDIYLQPSMWPEVTWCADLQVSEEDAEEPGDADVAYVRADLVRGRYDEWDESEIRNDIHPEPRIRERIEEEQSVRQWQERAGYWGFYEYFESTPGLARWMLVSNQFRCPFGGVGSTIVLDGHQFMVEDIRIERASRDEPWQWVIKVTR